MFLGPGTILLKRDRQRANDRRIFFLQLGSRSGEVVLTSSATEVEDFGAFAHKRFGKFQCRFSYLWNLTIIQARSRN